MIRFLKISLLALLPMFAIGQEKAANSEVYGHEWQFATGADPSGFTGSSPVWTGTFNPPSPGANLYNINGFTLQNIQVGDIFIDGNKGMFEITSINTPGTNPNVTVRALNDPFLLGFKVAPNGKGAVMRPSPEIGLLVPYVHDGGVAGGLTHTQMALLMNYNLSRVDSAAVSFTGGGGSQEITYAAGEPSFGTSNPPDFYLDTTGRTAWFYNGVNGWVAVKTKADNVNLNPPMDVDGDGSNETTVQQAIAANPPPTIETFGNLTSGNTVTVSATLPANEDRVLVFRNGLIQMNGTDYSISGQTITFSNRSFSDGEKVSVKF